ncbi:Glycine/D-amino acid oxidase [Rhizobium sp. RU20A]|uniref:NAD(P)/FAD-dependent oxidoreductase n=1 Tax=Rhizobium sp. RU20A TaxID=1907412 RepID=UPI000956E7CF|nr:FAD-binding oxidoreductase [Rhizobium sp. RU20A]SIQ22126.1 Glycine/D-amino acid oxidase [Rhizobium sp. RU20A]
MAPPRAQQNLWQATAPAAPTTQPLAGDLTVDVAVIGGGYTGLSAALHLAEKGVSVALAEAMTIGHGGSGRNVGLVNAGMWVKPKDLIGTLGESEGDRLLTALGDGPSLVFDLIERHGIDCEAVRNGTLHMAIGKEGLKDIRDREAQWQARGAPVSVVGADEAQRLTGAEGFAGALLDKRAGTVQPLAYARGLAHAAIAAGAKLFTNTPLTAATPTGTGWSLSFPGGRITAAKVILATNAYGSLVASAPWQAHVSELTPLGYFQFATQPLSGNLAATILPERQGCWDTGMVMTSFRLDRQNRMIFGSIGNLDAIAEGTHRAFAQRALAKLFPQIGPVRFEYWWDGRIGMTTTNLPRLHEQAPGVISVSGYNGRGISPGSVFGKALAAHVTGETSAIPLAPTPVVPDPWRQARALALGLGSKAKHMIDHRF